MKKIYTGIDLGSFSIKIVVCEVVNNKFHVILDVRVSKMVLLQIWKKQVFT